MSFETKLPLERFPPPVLSDKKLIPAHEKTPHPVTKPYSAALEEKKGGPTESLADRVKRLAAENARLRRREFCRACGQTRLSQGGNGVTFLPCGHFILCKKCSEKYNNCPACTKVIMATARTFLS